MKRAATVPVFFLLLLVLLTGPSYAWDWDLGKEITLNLRGDLTYGLKVRTQAPYGSFVTPGSTYYCSGDANFDRGAVGNNAIIGTLELQVDSEYLSFFGRFKPFVDFVYFDESLYSGFNEHLIDKDETKQHAAWNLDDNLEYFLEGRYGAFTGRIGRQIVQWGESMAPVYAPGVNVVSPFFVYHVTSAGYTSRDYQVPTHILWLNLEPTENMSFEVVWAPDFDPRFFMPVVGTFASPADIMGFGVKTDLVDDTRPLDWTDQQQGGACARFVFPSLSQFELGVYYYHYLNRFPMLTMQEEFPPLMQIDWPQLDMVGLSFSQAIQSFGLNLQLGGELAFRPNDPLQKTLVNSPFIASATGATVMRGAGGWDRGQTLTWVLNGMRMFYDVLPFTPWTFQMTALFEIYGKINMSYTNLAMYSDPQFTAYYMVSLPVTVADMIDNTTLTLGFDAMGHMYGQKGGLHNLTFTTKARYGNHWEALFGYNLIIGNAEQDPGGEWMWDRDAFTFKLTYHFI